MKVQKHLSLLGYKVVDKVTGFEGIVESISFDLYGCVQAVIRPTINEKGEVPDGRWFDIVRLDILSTFPVMNQPDFVDGPQADGKKGPAEKPTNRRIPDVR